MKKRNCITHIRRNDSKERIYKTISMYDTRIGLRLVKNTLDEWLSAAHMLGLQLRKHLCVDHRQRPTLSVLGIFATSRIFSWCPISRFIGLFEIYKMAIFQNSQRDFIEQWSKLYAYTVRRRVRQIPHHKLKFFFVSKRPLIFKNYILPNTISYVTSNQ